MEDNHIMDILGNYVEILERENDSLKAEIKSLEKLIDAKHKKRNEDSNLIAELKLAIVDQNDDIKTLKARIVDILKDKVNKMRIGDAFHRDLIVSNDINKELKRQVKTLKAENDKLKLLSCDDECQDAINYCNKLKAELDKVKQYNKTMDEILVEREEEIETLKQNKRDLIVSNDINKELRRQVKTLKAKNKELKLCSDVAFVELLTKDNDYLKSEVKALEEENDSLKDEAVKWNRKHNKLQDEALKPTFH